MNINLMYHREISYRITEVDNIDKIEYIISFPSGVKHSFPVDVDRTTGVITINLPILEDIIQIEYDGMGYIKITKTDGVILNLCEEEIHFGNVKTINVTKENTNEINFNKNLEPINQVALKTNEVLVSHSNTLEFIMSNIDRDKK